LDSHFAWNRKNVRRRSRALTLFFDVVVREDAVLARLVPTPVVRRDTVEHALTVCVK
jgi:hypothetical protein